MGEIRLNTVLEDLILNIEETVFFARKNAILAKERNK